MVDQRPHGGIEAVLLPQLDGKAFGEVPGADAGGIEGVDERENRRHVLELTFRGDALDEIADELGITHENAYQRRSRGMKDLKKLKEQYDA